MVLALINMAFAQETPAAAHNQWRVVADHFRPNLPKLAVMLDDAESDVLAFMDFPRAHRKQIASTNPLERLNAEIKRRTGRRRHLPERRGHLTPCRRAIARAERRVAVAAPLSLTRRTRSDQRQPKSSSLSHRYRLRTNPRRESVIHHSAGHDLRLRVLAPACKENNLTRGAHLRARYCSAGGGESQFRNSGPAELGLDPRFK